MHERLDNMREMLKEARGFQACYHMLPAPLYFKTYHKKPDNTISSNVHLFEGMKSRAKDARTPFLLRRNTMCLTEFEVCAQILLTILGSIVNIT